MLFRSLRLYLHRMSWDAYIKQLKEAEDGSIQEAAICGIAPGQESVWASSPGLAGITAEEIKKLAGDRSGFRQCGPHVAGMKCMMLRDATEDKNTYSLDLKTTRGADGNAYSICVGKTNNAIVIAQGTKDAQGGQLAKHVFKMVTYLRDLNF